MPLSSRKPKRPYRSSSRPSSPNYDRRANSNRRDIRMNSRRSSSPLRPIIIIIVILLIISGIVALLSATNDSKQASTPSYSQSDSTSSSSSLSESSTYQEESASEVSIPSENSSDSKASGLTYTDDRVPNYDAANPVWETIHFEWESQDNRATMYMDIAIDSAMYQYYCGLGRYYKIRDYGNYINDANNQELISRIVNTLREVTGSLSYSDAAVVREVAKFVQDVIEYQYDSDTAGEDDYPRYPIETLYEGQGDCEDTSILMAAILKEMGYEVGFLYLPGHLAVAIRTADDYSGGAYYEINGHRYLYIESTGSGWNIGEIPEKSQGQKATFFAIS